MRCGFFMPFWNQFRNIWLNEEKWIYFRLFAKNDFLQNWVTMNRWYTKVLNRIVKPVVTQYDETVTAIFFGIYGGDYKQEQGCVMDESTSTDLGSNKVLFIRLRLCVSQRTSEIKDSLNELIHENNTDLILTHEECRYRVASDLGNRYAKTSDGTINEERLLNFINYWNGACRYILSILVKDTLDDEVDIWGIPHLINNSLGTKLSMNSENKESIRISGNPQYNCPICGEILFMDTHKVMRYYLCPTCLKHVCQGIGNI